MSNDVVYTEWRDKLLWIIGHKICRSCDSPQKLTVKMDYENPFNCGCHCEHINSVLNRIADIESDIAHSSAH